MLPFCGYNMGDYFAHWLKLGAGKSPDRLPRIYFVNWFRKDSKGRFIWPGFGENSRVLKWIVERLEGTGLARETPIGRVPAKGALDVTGLHLSDNDLNDLLDVDRDVWLEESALIPEAYEAFGDRMPQGLWDEYRDLRSRLGA
jgi:phosphoenolpyruvate carboxykinase (GTP)